ncbi:MAG TPA: ABC-2 family transporter protein, partial [Kouleothrix sp.]|nr:ABC-2 family transporter protein [Kouleothrix sp.]
MLSLYFRLIGARIRAQMQYRVSFWMELIGFGLVTGLEFVAVAILFARFRAIAGWSLAEVALLYGLASAALGIAEMACRGFDSPFERMMQQGAFDTIMIRPIGSFFGVLASEFQLMRLGRVTQGLVVLGYALARLPIGWTPGKLLLLPLTLLSGAAIYCGLAVMGATVCFWTIKTPEVINIFTVGGAEASSYPLSIYSGLVRGVFLFVVPIAFANYPAALYLLGRADPFGLPGWAAWLAPLAAALFCALAVAFDCGRILDPPMG